MNEVEKAFYKDVLGYLDYIEGVVGDIVDNVEERRVGVFNLVFMLILLKMFEDFGLVEREDVRKVLRERLLDGFLGSVYSILERYIDVGFLRVEEERFLGCSGLVDGLRRVFEYEVKGKKGWKGLRFYDFRELGSGVLGGVYESFLGWLSKESKKKMGVCYTPKVIVEYMCRESLFYYFQSKLEGKVSEDGLVRFVRDGDVSGVRGYEEEVDKLLAEVKVCDPACGAGAFLVGMLDEIVRLRGLVSEASVCDLKRHAIERSLYGIDIDGRVVEICKLRLWFSMAEEYERRKAKLKEGGFSDIERLEWELCVAKKWEKGLSDDGVVAYVLDRVLGVFNELMRRYSDVIGIDVRFRIGNRGQLEVDVSDGYKSMSRLSWWSGSERYLIMLVVMLGLSDFLMYQGKGTNLLVLDEVFAPLDMVNRERVVELLQWLKGEDRTVVVVTHHEDVKRMVDWDDVWVVEKKDGVSYLRVDG